MGVMITRRGLWQSPRLLSSFPHGSTLLNTLSTLFKKKKTVLVQTTQTSICMQVVKQNMYKEVLFGLQKEWSSDMHAATCMSREDIALRSLSMAVIESSRVIFYSG